MENPLNIPSKTILSFLNNYDVNTYKGNKVHINDKSISVSKLAREIISSIEDGKLTKGETKIALDKLSIILDTKKMKKYDFSKKVISKALKGAYIY